MKFASLIAALLMANTAHAHTGHLAEVAGHGHWLGAAAIGAAIAIGLWASLKDRERNQDSEADAEAEDDDPELQEA